MAAATFLYRPALISAEMAASRGLGNVMLCLRTKGLYSAKRPTARLLVPQRLDRIQIGGLKRRIGSEDNSNHGTNHQAENGPIHWNDRGHFEVPGDAVASQNSENHPDHAAEFAEKDRFHDELGENVAFLCSHRAADSDLACAFRH